MEEKEFYSAEEVAEIVEAYRKIGENNSTAMENVRRYQKLAPESLQRTIGRLRNLEYEYYSKTPEQKKSIMEGKTNLTDFEKFKEFFRVFE
jgi:hypothetical protein